MKKRIISLGFEEPSKLEKDIIYVTFSYIPEPYDLDRDYTAGTTVVSKKEFVHHINGSEAHQKKYKHSGPPSFKLEGLIDELIKSNNGELDYSRLLEQGCNAYLKIEHIVKHLKS